MTRFCVLFPAIAFSCLVSIPVFAAYHHMGDTDSERVLEAYPQVAGTKLDRCSLCHTGGQYEKKPDKWVSLGSCQWCHYRFGYDGSGDILDTLNAYGMDYRSRVLDGDPEPFAAIEPLDSDGDGYRNLEEIQALRNPGDPGDDPEKVGAPCRVYTREALEQLPRHSQFMLMNTHKSGDFYARYTGVPVATFLEDAGMLSGATGIIVHAPDGWSQYHPLHGDPDPLMYPVVGIYPGAPYFYHVQADAAQLDVGWCSYETPDCEDQEPGAVIEVEGGLKLLLATHRDGAVLEPGRLTPENRLDGEGPFRIVPPQKVPGPPDQSVKSPHQDVVWPFDPDADHNAGFATRCATLIRVDPLPEGTTDIDPFEAGWDFVNQGKILVYGAIDPLHTVLEKLSRFKKAVWETDSKNFKRRHLKWSLLRKLYALKWMVAKGLREQALRKIERDLIPRMNGCVEQGYPDRNDWVTNRDTQLKFYWMANESRVLLGIQD